MDENLHNRDVDCHVYLWRSWLWAVDNLRGGGLSQTEIESEEDFSENDQNLDESDENVDNSDDSSTGEEGSDSGSENGDGDFDNITSGGGSGGSSSGEIIKVSATDSTLSIANNSATSGSVTVDGLSGSGTSYTITSGSEDWFSIVCNYKRTGYVFVGWTVSGLSGTTQYGTSKTEYLETTDTSFTYYVTDSILPWENWDEIFFKIQATGDTITMTAVWTELDIQYEDGYWYLEDGEFPQSAVTDTTLVSNLNAYAQISEESFSIAGNTYYAYTYSNNKYIQVTIGDNSAWFLVEPIRWLVGFSDSGADLPDKYSAGVSNDNLTLVSVFVLTYGTEASEASESFSWESDSNQLYSSAQSIDTSGSIYNISTEVENQSTAGLTQQYVTTTTTQTSAYSIASVDDLDTLSAYKAKQTDLVAFFASNGEETSATDSNVAYWTRNLSYNLTSSSTYGKSSYPGATFNGVYVTTFGTLSTAWQNTALGARLSMTVEEIYFEGDSQVVYSYDSDTDSMSVRAYNRYISGDIEVEGYVYYYGQLKAVTIVEEGNGSSLQTSVPTGFNSCKNMTSITLPNTITTIKSRAFMYCNGLTEFTIPSSVTNVGSSAFNYCTALGYIEIPDNIIELDSSVFGNCTGLIQVDLPETLNAIGTSTFQGCSSLYTITIPDSVTTLGSNAFYACTSLATVTIGTGMTTINTGAFRSCSALESITIPNNVTFIGAYAFSGCTYLKTINLSSGITSLSTYTFQNCTNLEKIWLSTNITAIGNYAFTGCTSLSIYFEGTEDWVTSNVKGPNGASGYTYWNNAGRPVYYGYNSTEFDYVGSLVFDFDEATLTATVAAYDATISDGLEIPETITHDGNVYIITTIGSVVTDDNTTKSGFQNCTNLTSIWIPKTITTIEASAFAGCSADDMTIYFEGSASYVSSNVSLGSGWNSSDCSVVYGYDKEAWLREEYDSESDYDGILLFTLNDASNTASVRAASKSISGEIDIPAYIVHEETVDEVTTYTIYKVTQISMGTGYSTTASGGFANCTEITAINLPSTISIIGKYAFVNCTSLETVTVSDGLQQILAYAFYGCTALTSFEMPDTVEYLGTAACYGCLSLESVKLSENLTALSEHVFFRCTSLTTIELPSTLTSIGSCCFQECEKLLSIEIPDSVLTIPSYCFRSCYSLSYIYLPASITKINNYALSNCTSLTSIEIPEGATIGMYAFSGCTSLTEILLPDDLVTLETYVFSRCTALTSIDLPSTLTTIGSYAFNNCTSLTEIILPDSVTSIKNSAFSSCTSLTEIILSDGLVSIGDGAFSVCTSLTEINIPDSVTSIGSGIFQYCNSLTSIFLPFVGDQSDNEASAKRLFGYYFQTYHYSELCRTYSVTQYYSSTDETGTIRHIMVALSTVEIRGGRISYGAFMNCTSITSIYIGADVSEIQSYAFSGLTDTTIYFEMTEQEFNDAVTNGSLIIGSDWNVSGCTIVFGASM